MENKISNETLKKYAKIASEVFMDDPVYVQVAKNKKIRKTVIYHGTLIRMYASRKNSLFYFDEEERGMLVLKHVSIDYKVSEFLKCPNWPAVILLRPYAAKLFGIIGKFDNKNIFDENTYTISPLFVAKEHQGKGVARKLVERALEDMRAKGCKIGLDTQNPVNVPIYEKIGFKLVKEEYFEENQLNNYYMIIE